MPENENPYAAPVNANVGESGATDAAAAAAKPLPPNVKLLAAVSLLNDTSSEMIYPLLPQFLEKVLHGTTAHLGIIEGVAESASSVLKLFSGGWSDRAGTRKIFVFVGYVMAALTRPLTAFVTGPWQMFAVRVSDRIGKGIRSAPRDALIADCTDETNRGRAYGFHRAMDHLGSILGPAIAMLFLWCFPENYRWLFFLSIVPGIMVFLLVGFFLKEEKKEIQVREPIHFSLKPFDNRFKLYLLALLIFTLGNSSDAFLLNRASEVGIPTLWIPALWGAFHVVKGVGNVLAGRAVDRVGTRPMIIGGWLVYAAIYVLFALATEPWQVIALFLGYGVFYALTEPAEKTLVANLVSSDHKGLAFGWFNLTIGIGALPANILFGYVYAQAGYLAAFSMGAAFAFVAGMLLLAVRPNAVKS